MKHTMVVTNIPHILKMMSLDQNILLKLHVWWWQYLWPGGSHQTTLLQKQRPPQRALCLFVAVCVSVSHAGAHWEEGRSSAPPLPLAAYQAKEAGAREQLQPVIMKRIARVNNVHKQLKKGKKDTISIWFWMMWLHKYNKPKNPEKPSHL